MNETVVLAFSGGLDTSFCVPWLRERGYDVVTVFVDTGGVDAAERAWIERRAGELGAREHITAEGGAELWQQVVVPLIRGGQWYQNAYPVLCADRYVVVEKALEVCDRLGTRKIAHGCTAMGNDQVRFDLTVNSSGDYEIIAPVRDIQSETDRPREFEKAWLAERGFGVREKTSRYTINENALGVTVSGAEIDHWQPPAADAWQITTGSADWPREPLQVTVEFAQGVAHRLDGVEMGGPALLAELNRRLGAYGVGRGIYTGDTAVGLKGRIAFEAPGLTGLRVAHDALEQATCSRHQNAFKPAVAERWVELVYFGFYHDPLRTDLEALLTSSQRSVNGVVTLETAGASVTAVAIDSPYVLSSDKAVYAQTADWSVEEARGFIRLFGQSSQRWTAVNRARR